VTKLHCGILTLIGLTLAACSSGPEVPAAPRSRGEIGAIKISARVESVDLATRRITLKSPQGSPETYIVGPEVKRLAEIKVGDTITLDYKVAATAELREPTAEEKKTPVVVAEGADRAPADQPPGAAFARVLRVVALVEAVDAQAKAFSIRGPLGGLIKIPVDDPALLASVKIWQAVVVTFVESALLSVEPGPK
jgi:hypothetical protein